MCREERHVTRPWELRFRAPGEEPFFEHLVDRTGVPKVVVVAWYTCVRSQERRDSHTLSDGEGLFRHVKAQRLVDTMQEVRNQRLLETATQLIGLMGVRGVAAQHTTSRTAGFHKCIMGGK